MLEVIRNNNDMNPITGIAIYNFQEVVQGLVNAKF